MKSSLDDLSEARKLGQDEGRYPEWFSSGGFQMFEQRYLHNATGFKEQARRIASTAAKHLKKAPLIEKYEEIFFNMMWEGDLSCSTPVLANTGTGRGMPVSCSGTYIEDSISGFYKGLLENAVLTQEGFGTSVYLGDIRPRGTPISRGGKAAGIMPILNDFRQMSMDVSQGGVRRGSIASYIPMNHGDFWEVVNELKTNTESLNIGWNVYDEDLLKLTQGDKELGLRFAEILNTKMPTGKGYYFFPDKVNRHSPQMYKDLGLEVKASNLCNEVTLMSDVDHSFTCQPSFAKVYLSNGNIVDMGDVEVGDSIWSNEGATIVVNKLSSGIKPVYRYTTSSGQFIGTADHRVVCGGEKIEVDKANKIDLGLPLKVDNLDKLEVDPISVLAGLLVGDGTYRNGKNQLCVGKKDQDYYQPKNGLSNFISPTGYLFFRDCVDILEEPLNLTYEREVPSKYYYSDSNTKRGFLKGLYSANGSVRKVDVAKRVSGIVLKQSSYKLCLQVQEMLFSLGVSSKLHKQKGVATKFLNGEYTPRDSYHLGIYSRESVATFRDTIGFLQSYKNEKVVSQKFGIDKKRKSSPILSKEYVGDFEVFHIEVDNESHTYNTGGLNVSNCVLSALNLANYNKWKDTDAIFNATVFLDCIASEFIERGKRVPDLAKAVRFTEKGRALGLGVCGYHTYLMQEGIAFESFEAYAFNNNFFATFKKESLRASQWLAKELGEPEWCKGYGVRNTHRTALMPTKSTALIMGGVSEGINPVPAMVFTQASSAGEITRVDPTFLKLMKDKGVYNKATVKDITENRGSCQHVDWLTGDEKLIFRTAFEINQEVVLRKGSSRGKHLCQWQSLNLFFSVDEDEEYIAKIHQQAFMDEGIRGLYYIYSKAGVVASKDECLACD